MMKKILVSLVFVSSVALMLSADERRPSNFRDINERPAAREEIHAMLHARHTLLPSDRQALADDGCTIVKELGDGNYVVRVRTKSFDDASRDAAVSSLGKIDPSSKIRPELAGTLSNMEPEVRVNLVFFDDVAFADAKTLVEKHGGWIRDPFHVDYSLTQRIDAIVPRQELDAIAAEDPVMFVAPPPRPIKALNAVAAQMSNVTPLFSAPYNLSGAGLNVSIWDIGSTDATHKEFGGRVTTHSPAAVDDHPTHVAGTIGAAGIDPKAKGMAPSVNIHQWDVDANTFLNDKQTNFAALNIVSDNNSWGWIQGWDYDSSAKYSWVWYGSTDTSADFGVYDITTSALDKIARQQNTVISFAAGNDNTDSGPNGIDFPHWEHYHQDDRSTVYCYSSNGSGTDCPTPCNQCETVRHPPDGPWASMGIDASAKNVIGVGAINTSFIIAGFSSRGPTADGRIKPDVVAKGVNQYSTVPRNRYQTMQGTSMATPVITGISALLAEQWKKSFGVLPDGAVVRSLLIGTATDLGNPGPDYVYGFGLANAQAAVDTIIADGGTGKRIARATAQQGTTTEFPMTVNATGNVRVTLLWPDPETSPFPAKALINDLDLQVIGPDSTVNLPYVLDPNNPGTPATRGVNVLDNKEQVEIANAAPGTYKVRVIGKSVPSAGGQPFIVVTTHDMGPAVQPCFDPFEPNDTEATAWGLLRPARPIRAALCQASDVDFYRLVVDRSGPLAISVTTTLTPLTATLTGPGVNQTVSVAANSTKLLSATVGSGTNQPIAPETFLIRVAPTGALGDNTSYTLLPTFNSSQPTHRHALRHP